MPEPKFEIRRFEPRDLHGVVAMERRCFPDPWSEGMFRDEVNESESNHSRVAIVDEAIAGYMISWFVHDEAHLGNIAVDPNYRSLGVGAGLIDDLIDEARLRGTTQIVLEVRIGNRSAIRLYEKFGFEPVAIRKNYYPEDHEDALVMMKNLTR